MTLRAFAPWQEGVRIQFPSHVSPRHALPLLLAITALTGACSKSSLQLPDSGISVPSARPIEMRRAPDWVTDPGSHELYPPERFLTAVGRSAFGISRAEAAAFTALDSIVDARLDDAWGDAFGKHPFFQWEGGFFDWVVESLSPGSGMWDEIRPYFGIGPDARVYAEGEAYVLAAVDRRSAIDYLRARHARSDAFLEEAVDSALVASSREEWFRCVGWANEAVRHEAERAAATMMRAAIGDTLPFGSYSAHGHIYALSDSLDRLMTDHGWSVEVSFQWDALNPPPARVEAQLKQRLLRYLVDTGFRVGMGQGCPSPIPVEESPGVLASPPEFDDPPPHHVVWITARGTSGRTPVATWESRLGFDIRAKTCDVGEMVELQSMGEIVGEEAQDRDAAYLKALNLEELDRILETGYRRVNLLPPIELLPEPITP
jgi:hypothetical protein